MTSIGDIFDLPDGNEGTYHDEEKPEKKPRKKVEMSDEKKTAMLERLKAGREKRAENLKSKSQPKEEIVVKKEEVKQPEVIISKKKDNVESTNKKHKETEDERLSFIKMMSGKSKPIEKVERPKKKVYSEPKKEEKEDKVKNEVLNKPKEIKEPVNVSNVVAPVVIAKQPVVIRTFKKPIWG
jgi:hypothetical protein